MYVLRKFASSIMHAPSMLGIISNASTGTLKIDAIETALPRNTSFRFSHQQERPAVPPLLPAQRPPARQPILLPSRLRAAQPCRQLVRIGGPTLPAHRTSFLRCLLLYPVENAVHME